MMVRRIPRKVRNLSFSRLIRRRITPMEQKRILNKRLIDEVGELERVLGKDQKKSRKLIKQIEKTLEDQGAKEGLATEATAEIIVSFSHGDSKIEAIRKARRVIRE